jgi:protein gp37
MADNSIIAWTNHTLNPWMGCMKVSDGCKHCYADTLVTNRMGLKLWGPASTTTRQVTSNAIWRKPITWNREAALRDEETFVFCASLCDVFEDHPIAEATRPRLWDLIRSTPSLTWQLLTKRPERIAQCLPADWGEGWPHVWLGTSIEDMRVAERADALRTVPAVVRFISYEPALGPLDDLALDGIDWVIYGGESGPGYRPHDLAWPRVMRDRCDALGVAFFFKQSAAARTEMGIRLDGELIRLWPTPRVVTHPSFPGYRAATTRRTPPTKDYAETRGASDAATVRAPEHGVGIGG